MKAKEIDRIYLHRANDLSDSCNDIYIDVFLKKINQPPLYQERGMDAYVVNYSVIGLDLRVNDFYSHDRIKTRIYFKSGTNLILNPITLKRELSRIIIEVSQKIASQKIKKAA